MDYYLPLSLPMWYGLFIGFFFFRGNLVLKAFPKQTTMMKKALQNSPYTKTKPNHLHHRLHKDINSYKQQNVLPFSLSLFSKKIKRMQHSTQLHKANHHLICLPFLFSF